MLVPSSNSKGVGMSGYPVSAVGCVVSLAAVNSH